MVEADKNEFKALYDVIAENYGKEILSVDVLRLRFGALARYSIHQVRFGMECHLADTKEGQFFPGVANIVKQIEGEELKPDEILAMAELQNTPLGVFCRSHVTSWTINNGTPQEKRQMAYQCLELVADWKKRGLTGEYTEHELRTLLNHGINPLRPFCRGMQPPLYQDQLKARIGAIQNQAEAVQKIAAPEKMTIPAAEMARMEAEGRAVLAGLSGMFESEDEAESDNEQ